jgi:pyridinium-3,5-biscarboxylic acid mononucleotide sulfurtransferase
MDRTAQHLTALRHRLRALQSTLVCFSGGIDSTLVLAIATEQLGARAVAFTAVSPALPQSERAAAQQIAQQLGAPHHFVSSQELTRPGYVNNAPDRCFHCKSELYSIATAKAAEWNLASIVNGTNADDLHDYRPGLQAASAAAIQSPLAELGLTKEDVRALARELGLSTWSKPAMACLASRIPYGTAVTPERLGQVEQLETALHALGFVQVRVRWHGPLARIELDVNDLERACSHPARSAIVQAGLAAGFSYVTIDLAGYRMGSHNELLQGRSLRLAP